MRWAILTGFCNHHNLSPPRFVQAGQRDGRVVKGEDAGPRIQRFPLPNCSRNWPWCSPSLDQHEREYQHSRHEWQSSADGHQETRLLHFWGKLLMDSAEVSYASHEKYLLHSHLPGNLSCIMTILGTFCEDNMRSVPDWRFGIWLVSRNNVCVRAFKTTNRTIIVPAVALTFEEMRTSYASGREICIQELGNTYQRKEIEKGMPHFKSIFQIQRNKTFFANDALFPVTVCSVIGCVMCWDRAPFSFLRTLYASLSWFCVQLDFYVYYTQKFALTRPLYSFQNSTIGTLLTTVDAADEDIDSNGMVQFSFISGNEDGAFELNSQTGELRTAKELDYEIKASYQVDLPSKDTWAAVALAFEEMRTPYGSRREICVQRKLRNEWRVSKAPLPPTIQRNNMFFANDARFPFTIPACLSWLFTWFSNLRSVETEARFLRTPYASLPWFCAQLDFYA